MPRLWQSDRQPRMNQCGCNLAPSNAGRSASCCESGRHNLKRERSMVACTDGRRFPTRLVAFCASDS